MVGFGAALQRGQISLLPSARGRSSWQQLLAQYPDCYLLSEKPQQLEAADAAENDTARIFDLSPFLVLAAHAKHNAAMPEIHPAQTAAILFTSGSTGEPRAHNKTWGQLCHGAKAVAEALDWGHAPSCAVLGSVPQQHMFGLETTVMLPWYAGIPAHAQRPLLPADLQAALASVDGPSWWMTTPLHLRGALRAPLALPGLQGIVASTMSLSTELAKAAEAAWGVPVMEIYGSTETGAMAMRRTAADDCWRPLQGVTLRREEDAILASGEHFDGPLPLADELELLADGRFNWLGRLADLVKVAGKRASLAGLNQSLLGIEGVEDGVYFLPGLDAADGTDGAIEQVQRLSAFYVSPSTTPQQVMEALRSRVDPVFLPRPLFRVSSLPRSDNGKLTRDSLLRLYNECRTTEGRMLGAGAQNPIDTIASSHPALAGHFPGNPMVPGVVILARVAAAIRERFPERGLGTLLHARFHIPLKPDEEFSVEQELHPDRVTFKVRRGADILASGQWAINVVPASMSGAQS
jgi:acyl-coenzyme A synthetase/AMP-(fatty) acid ligase